MFLWTAAAALSCSLPSTITTANAFALSPLPRPMMMVPLPATTTATTTRLFFSNSNSNKNKNEDNILKKMAKNVLPKKWFQSEEEQKAELARQQVKDNVSGGIKELLKDAPLPVRMMGSMVAPLLSKVASEMSEGMAEQQQQMESVLNDAKMYIMGDDVALQALGGEPIQVGNPFSQSSSTSIINGQKSINIALAFPVEGRYSGVAQVQANQNGITQMILQVNGRQINVSLSSPRGSTGGGGGVGRNRQKSKYYDSGGDDDNIIEAEIIEKDSTK